MRHSRLLPATTLLTSVTAAALLGAVLSIRPPARPAEADGAMAANRAVVFAFYDAVNAAIATGEVDGLVDLVAPDLLLDGESGSIGLGRRLRAIHATSPTLRLTVADLAVDGDLAIARLVAGGEPDGTPFLGLGLGRRPAPWGSVAVLRLAAGRIVALDSGGAEVGLLEPVVAASYIGQPQLRAGVAAERVTLVAGEQLAVAGGNAPRLVYVEAGAVDVEVRASGPHPAPPATLVAGQDLAVRAGTGYVVRTAADTPAVLPDVQVVWVDQVRRPGSSRPPARGEGPLTKLPAGPMTLAVGRVTLAPGARLSWAAAAGPVLLQVEAGTAHLDAGVDLDSTTGWTEPIDDATQAQGTSLLLAAAYPVELRAEPVAPLSLLVIAWLPAD
jgi:hypothetical protein